MTDVMTRRSAPALADRLKPFSLPLGIVALLLVFALIEPRVISGANLRNIALQTSFLAIFAAAQCVVLLTRGFDLSLGVTVSLVSVGAGMAMTSAGVAAGLAAGCGIALAVGLFNGLLIGAIGINAFVATLGTSYVVMALASTLSGGFPVAPLPPAFNSIFAQGSLFGIRAAIWVALIVLLAIGLMLRFTTLGRRLYLVGASARAATAAGIRPAAVLIAAYAICGLLAGIGALLLTARTGSGEPNLGGNLTLESIAAAVVGGAKLTGGEGGISSALLGALFITVLSNGMNLVQVDGYIQQVFLGAIIVLSLILGRDGARR